MKLTRTLTLAAFCLGALQVCGKESSAARPYTEILSAAPAAELPATTVATIKGAKAREREAVTPQVVKAAVGINPAATVPIVGAVAKSLPELAAIAAGTAASEQPKLACAIARAAAAAAPSKAGKIVAAVCRAVPNQYRAVAVAVAEVAPTSGKEILKSVGSAMPDLKSYIDAQTASFGLGVLPVGVTLDQAALALSRSDSANPVRAVAPTASSPAGASPVLASASDSAGAASVRPLGGLPAAPSAPASSPTGPPALPKPPITGGNPPSTSGSTVSPSRNYARP